MDRSKLSVGNIRQLDALPHKVDPVQVPFEQGLNFTPEWKAQYISEAII